MDSFWALIGLGNSSLRLVVLGTIFLSLSASTVGTFAFLRKRSLVGDAVAHALLPGIALAFMITQSKSPLLLLLGALVSGWLAMAAIEWISQRSKLSSDTAIAAILSLFFGLGIVLLTHIQHSGAGNQAGLDQFLFGQAAGLSPEDLRIYLGVALLLLLITLLLYKEWVLYSFNPDFARSLGLPVRALAFGLNSLTVLAIAIGIQSVGVVLMAALLITPAAAARSWTDRLPRMLLIGALMAAASAWAGSWISFRAPGMPTGPWIVMCLSLLALLSIFLAPQRGLLGRLLRQRRNRRKINDENLLKAFYRIGEKRQRLQLSLGAAELREERDFAPGLLAQSLKRLKRRGMILPRGSAFQLSRAGLDEARRVVRLHRLWEMYLTQRLRLKPDHIHPNAETMEHLITPELEEQLLRELDYPREDPHASPIPYQAQAYPSPGAKFDHEH